MTARLIFFNGFVGRTAKARERIVRERILATVERFWNREDLTEEHRIQKVIIIGEADQPNYADVCLMKHLGAAGIPVDRLELAGHATDTFHAIRLFLAKAEELYPGQHLRVHVATHRWLMPRILYYMKQWCRPNTDKPLPVKVRGCCPTAGYEPGWWERLRECFRRVDAQNLIAFQRDPVFWDRQRQLFSAWD